MNDGMKWTLLGTICLLAFILIVAGVAMFSNADDRKDTRLCGDYGISNIEQTPTSVQIECKDSEGH
jgi:hypothetical protein